MSLLDDYLKNKTNSPRVEYVKGEVSVELIATHVTAFLNSGGGLLVLDTQYYDSNRLEKNIHTLVSPTALLSVSKDQLKGDPVMIIDVPGGKDIPFVCDGTIYLRSGNQTKKADAFDLQSMLQSKATTVERWERRACIGLAEDDLDQDQINETLMNMLGAGSFEWGNSDVHELLHTLGCKKSDGSLTNAADTCFGKTPAVRHPQIRIRAFAFESETSNEFQDHQDYDGSVVELLDNARRFIARNINIGASFSVDLMRKSNTLYPDAAIREALVNALAHRDYASPSGGITIKVFPKKLEIWNSGSLPDGWDQKKLLSDHPSIPHNPDIAHFLYHRGYMERIGRGTLKILQSCSEAGLPRPKWKSNEGVTITFFAPQSLASIKSELNTRQLALLEELQSESSIRPKDYFKGIANDVSERQARRDLTELEKLGLLIRKGSGPSTTYTRT